MVVLVRRLVLGLLAVCAAVAIVIVIDPRASWLAAVVAACAIGAVVIITLLQPDHRTQRLEADFIEALSEDRHRELIRGTSLYLRDAHYRYSVRLDATEAAERNPFTETINTVRLGFIPAVITDNDNDQQAPGFVAFVYDGQRWRGPGLPCGGYREDAIAHAGRCVRPIDDDDDHDG